MNKWSLALAVFLAASLLGCGRKSRRKAETEWEEGGGRWEEEEEVRPAATIRRTPLRVEEAAEEEPVAEEEPAAEEEAVEIEEVEAADDEGEAAEEDE